MSSSSTHECECGRTFATGPKKRQHQEHGLGCQSHKEARNIKYQGPASTPPPQAPGLKDPLLHLAKARVRHGTPRAVIEGMKQCLQDQMRAAHTRLTAELQNRIGQQQAANLEELVQSVFEAGADLGARDSELALLRASPAYVKPVSRHLGKCPLTGEEFVAYDTPLDKNLEAMFATAGLWDEIKSGAATMMQSAASRPDELSGAAGPEFSKDRRVDDVYDGTEFRKFMCKVNIQDKHVPLIFMFYYDGLEVVNGLGAAHGIHELGCFYWALLNLTPHSRLSRTNIRLATVCYKRAIGFCGMEKVVAGRSKADESLSWVQWMKVLNRGLTLTTPDGPTVFRGGTAILSADTPAAAELRGTKKAVGPSTKSICRNCHCAQTGGAHRQACSFLAGLEQKWKLPNRSTPFRLRSVADVKAYMAKLTDVTTGACTHAELEAWMQDQGVNTFHGALWEMPHFSMFTGCPMDMMHIWLEGVARQGLGAVCYWLKRECKANLYELPTRIAAAAKLAGRGVSDYPYLSSSRVAHLGEGSEGGRPATDCSFPGTAAQIAHFVLDMAEILRPLVPETKRGDGVWQMALKMDRIGKLLWQRSFSHQDILDLDTAIYLHDCIYLGSPFLQHLWKPKNHYLSHLPFEILQWGPPRAYWCMNFEQENQVMKEGASGNYANPVMSAAEHKSLCVALEAEEQKQAHRTRASNGAEQPSTSASTR
jgi:hypothetical protein